MSAVLDTREARLETLTRAHLDAVIAVEQQAYTHPWTPGNFIDSIQAGYHGQCLVAAAPTPPAVGRPGGGSAANHELIGYFVAMQGVDEVHLLNITVAPAYQRQGWAALMLEALGGWARAQGAQWLWLEVRQSNERAQQVYLRHGFRRVGQRKSYYPATGGREDAIVMSLAL
jgi:ribosomal-protein-alanine N-acetyltransferase